MEYPEEIIVTNINHERYDLHLQRKYFGRYSTIIISGFDGVPIKSGLPQWLRTWTRNVSKIAISLDHNGLMTGEVRGYNGSRLFRSLQLGNQIGKVFEL